MKSCNFTLLEIEIMQKIVNITFNYGNFSVTHIAPLERVEMHLNLKTKRDFDTLI